jgi:hypothetical protein
MAKVEVEYTVKIKQIINWPDDEMEDFNYDNLCCNLDFDKGSAEYGSENVIDVKVNGENHDF